MWLWILRRLCFYVDGIVGQGSSSNATERPTPGLRFHPTEEVSTHWVLPHEEDQLDRDRSLDVIMEIDLIETFSLFRNGILQI